MTANHICPKPWCGKPLTSDGVCTSQACPASVVWPPHLAGVPYWELVGRTVRRAVAASPAAREHLADIGYAQSQPEVALDIVHAARASTQRRAAA